MNERNVAAMRAAIERALERNCGHIDFCTGDFDGFVQDVAEEALVPSALTDEEAEAVAGEEGWDSDAEGNEFRCDSLNAPAKVRAALGRIAKGEHDA